MSIDLSGIKLSGPEKKRPIEPEKIFKSLTLRGSIENIWEPQSRAVNEWFFGRDKADIGIEMATGGGKTLVGLLVGQSCVNELRKPGLYVCPTNQLAEQTLKVANETGLRTAAYLDGEWADASVYDESRGLCITNYAAVFNSHSRLEKWARPGAIIFDDAHVAGDEVRRQYTLRLNRGHSAYFPVLDLVRPSFTGPHQAAALEAIGREVPVSPLFLPQFEMRKLATQLRHLLQKHGVDQVGTSTWFPWGHIGSRLDVCVMLVAPNAIEIAPAVPPVRGHWSMAKDIRRIYLTATLPSAAEFAQTFGVPGLPVVRPEGKLGTAQRLFVLPQGDSDEEQREAARELLEEQKACIIVPSRAAAGPWLDEANLFRSDDRHEEIERFAAAPAPEKLILAARYHGIDLPGDACRVLVLDGLPRGSTLLQRFVAEGLQAETLRAAQTAVRVTQAIGRIFRSNTDHGAVVLAGPALQRWIRQPTNRAWFPDLIQQQIALGLSLREQVVDLGRADYRALLRGVLDGSAEWDEMYRQNIELFEADPMPPAPDWLPEVAVREHVAYSQLWEGNAAEAAAGFAALADDTADLDPDLAAWYRHWAGSAYQEAGDEERAALQYVDAANRRAALGRPEFAEGSILSRGAPRPSAQAKALVEAWRSDRSKSMARLRGIVDLMTQEAPAAKQAELSIERLGTYLGLASTRPDTKGEGGTGPDVAWRETEGGHTLGLELKTEKAAGSQYRKKEDVGQAHDHVEWAKERDPEEQFDLIWVGPPAPVSRESHPPKGLRVIEPSAFADLAARVLKVYEVLEQGSEDAEATAERFLRALGLRWPECWRSLPSVLAVDLQTTLEDGGEG